MVERKISEIAREIRDDWVRPYYAAAPYLNAMLKIESIDDMFGADPARVIVLYFLSNAGQWRGEVARRVKEELNRMVATKTTFRGTQRRGRYR